MEVVGVLEGFEGKEVGRGLHVCLLSFFHMEEVGTTDERTNDNYSRGDLCT